MRKKTVFMFIFFVLMLFSMYGFSSSKFYNFSFSNGLKCTYLRIKNIKIATIIFEISSGYSNSSINTTETTNLLFTALFGKSGAFKTPQYLSRYGIEFKAEYYPESTKLIFKFRNENLKNAIKTILRKFNNPLFDTNYLYEIVKEKSSNTRKLYLYPSLKTIKILLPKIVFGEHPYGKVPDPKRLITINSPFLLKFFRQNITPNNTSIFIIGDEPVSSIQKTIAANIGLWKKNIIFQEYIPPLKNIEDSVVIGNFKDYYILYGGVVVGTDELSSFEFNYFKYILYDYYNSRVKSFFIERNYKVPYLYVFKTKKYSLLFLIWNVNEKEFREKDLIVRNFVKYGLGKVLDFNEIVESAENFIGRKFLEWESMELRYYEYENLKKKLKTSKLTIESLVKLMDYKKIERAYHKWFSNGIFIYFGNSKIKGYLKPSFYRVYYLDEQGLR